MSHLTPIWLRLGLLTGFLLLAVPVMAQQGTETDLAAELTKLRMNRVATLQRLLDLSFVGYRQGQFPIDQVLDAQHDLMEAQLEIAETPDQRIAMLERQLEITHKTLEAAKKLRAAHEVSQCDTLRAKAALMGVEIKLLQERAREKATSR